MQFLKFEEFSNNSITCFDIDNTLTHTGAIIRGFDNRTGSAIQFTEKEFNSIRNREHYTFDFSDFSDLQILKRGKLKTKIVNELKRLIREGQPVAIITARDNKNLIIDYFRFLGVTINPTFIFTVNDPSFGFKGTDAERKRQAFEILIKRGFNKFIYYDDDLNNIKAVETLKSKKDIEINSILV